MSNASRRPHMGAGPVVSSGSKVVLVVSQGPPEAPRTGAVAVPEVAGKTQGDALDHLQKAGLNAQVFNDYNAKTRRGHVVDQFPAAGQLDAANSGVVLLISDGPATETSPTTLPDVVGLSEHDALGSIESVGLSPEVVRQHHPNVAEGVVFAQLPSQASVARANRKKQDPMRWVWIALAIVVLIAVGIFAYIGLTKGKPVTVPNVVGMTQAQAEKKLSAAKLKVTTAPKPTTKAAPGTVVVQTPAAGGTALTGSSVLLELAVKPAPTMVPDVVGKTSSQAETAIKAAGLVSEKKSKSSGSVAKGSVISQSPSAGGKVDTGSKVTITVSKGPEFVTVPDLVGLTQRQAVGKADALDLSTKISSAYSSSVPTGVVSAQSPEAGQSIPKGSTIGLTVSLGHAPSAAVDVPDVLGQTKSAATATLKNAGFTASSVTWNGTGKPAEQVVDQAPKVGDKAATKSTVVVFVSSGK